MSDILKVFLLLETSRAFGRGLLRGVIRWSQLHRTHLLLGSVGHFEQKIPEIKPGENAGIIATLSSIKLCQEIQKTRLPVVAVEPAFEAIQQVYQKMNASTITVNEKGTAVMIAEHFLKNGFRNFAYCGIPNNTTWSESRGKHFVQYLQDSGHECTVYPCSFKPKNPFHWEKDSKFVAKWLHQLPPQTALMVCNDDRGRHVLEICKQEKIQVPKRLSVIGVDDDDLVCELTDPSLSSVALDVSSTGFRAMEHLAALMAQPETEHQTIYVDPLFVSERRSSDFYAFSDPLVFNALRFIKDNFLHPIGVDDVVKAVKVSRRTLERRFMDFIGSSIHDEIILRRHERAKQLLLNTDINISKIAILAGFCHLQQMLRVFHAKEKCTPTKFRSPDF